MVTFVDQPLHGRYEGGTCGLWHPAERIHIEIFNGGEPMSPGVVGPVTRSPHPPEGDAAPGGVVRAKRHRRTLERIGLSEHSGIGRSVRRSGPLVVPDRCVS